MCGISGFLTSSPNAFTGGAEVILRRMADSIQHRGPDSYGHWFDIFKGIGLAHRRLSIVDLSPAGAQPMISFSGRYVIVFNGEIYNHIELRKSIEYAGNVVVQWAGLSDTETLLAGFEYWGIIPTIQKAVGMFAIAVWDRQTQQLTLIRDRIGEKPLYFGWQGHGNKKCFLFGSELKSLRSHPSFCSDVNRDALCSFMRHNYIPGPHSIYKDIFKLPPGSYLTISLRNPVPEPTVFWSLEQVSGYNVLSPFDGGPVDAVNDLEVLLKDTVSLQMMSDVPLGAFLSGGIDSSTVVALMQAQSISPVKTFTIGFNEDGYNEAVHAKAVAQHLGTDHTELYVKPDQVLDIIAKLPEIYCEPFADSSQIPTLLVSQLARSKVIVSLSGDGGDELFCGYRRYRITAGAWKWISRFPRPLRNLVAGMITSVQPVSLDKLGNLLSIACFGDKLHKGASLLNCCSVADLYKGMVSHWADPANLVIDGNESATVLSGSVPVFPGLGDVERMMGLDMLSYLPDDILVKVDRAAMSAGLETRVPLLDHRLVEFAWSLPLGYKLRDGVTKWPLRQVLYRYVPRELVERPKMGFGVPIGRWLRGPLRDWAETLLAESRLQSEGFFNPAPIRQKWEEHLSEHRNWQYLLWDVLMFQAWFENNRD